MALLSVGLVACGSGANTESVTPVATSQPASVATTQSASNLGKLVPVSATIAVNIVAQSASGAIAFEPSTLSILPGTTVIWNNTTAVDQDLISPVNGVFTASSKVLKKNSYKMTFHTAGTIIYSSKENPQARGTLLIESAKPLVDIKLTGATDAKGGNYLLSPAGLVIKAGTTVVWDNESNAPHVLASDRANVFPASSSLAKDGSYKMLFSTPGTYTYYSKMFPSTRGVIVVVP